MTIIDVAAVDGGAPAINGEGEINNNHNDDDDDVVDDYDDDDDDGRREYDDGGDGRAMFASEDPGLRRDDRSQPYVDHLRDLKERARAAEAAFVNETEAERRAQIEEARALRLSISSALDASMSKKSSALPTTRANKKVQGSAPKSGANKEPSGLTRFPSSSSSSSSSMGSAYLQGLQGGYLATGAPKKTQQQSLPATSGLKSAEKKREAKLAAKERRELALKKHADRLMKAKARKGGTSSTSSSPRTSPRPF